MKRPTEISLKLVQRIVIFFCVKVGWGLSDTRTALSHVFDDDYLSRSRINYWYKEFKEGRTQLVDLHRSPRQRSGRSAVNIQAVQQVIAADNRSTVSAIEAETGVPKSTVHRILKKDLNLKLKCARFVPTFLTPRHLRLRLETSHNMLRYIQRYPNFLHRVIPTDETWVHQYDPETRRQSSAWLGPDEARPVKARKALSTRKCMLVTFFDFKGMVHFEFVRGRTVNSEMFAQILGRLKTAILTKRPRNRHPVIHMDNASAHTGLLTRLQMIHSGLQSTDHPPCSPDLAPSDFWLFPCLKLGLRGQNFANLDELEEAVADQIGNIPSRDYEECIMRTWLKRWAHCVFHDGDYFEGLD